ncbi:hypothetical protein [Spirosoma validum]|uniref:Uncharacterized protein n=1 Tax=Spirosoma validum TaxID=2771355 RepID=A0A927AZK8_9BACT|nr:hypothetical protein [Spirosoma validum]MBD2752643.1 hypothetical protein [Spirosoma validum]
MKKEELELSIEEQESVIKGLEELLTSPDEHNTLMANYKVSKEGIPQALEEAKKKLAELKELKNGE